MSHRTPETEALKVRVLEWHAAREKLGTAKKLARELGVSDRTVEAIIWEARNEDRV